VSVDVAGVCGGRGRATLETDWRQRDAERAQHSTRERASIRDETTAQCRPSCGLPCLRARQALKSVPSQGGAVGARSPHGYIIITLPPQLRKGSPYMKRPSLSSTNHAWRHIGHGKLLAVGVHWRVGTRDVDAGRALSCGFSLLPPSPVTILLPAPPVCLTSLREEG
jgi:hypothetical protein